MQFDLVGKVKDYLAVSEFVPPVEWCEKNIDFSGDISAPRERIDFELSPYLIAPLGEWDFRGVRRKVTIMAPEQTGKTLLWLAGLVWSFEFMPCLSIVCYTSDDDAKEANSDKLLPVMQNIPHLSSELARPYSKTKDHYRLSTATSYFMGSGARVVSKSARIRIGDEVDDWLLKANVKDLEKRGRSFKDSMFWLSCTPTDECGEINKSFLTSSRGYWFLRCPKCKKLTMRSCDTRNLQFESVEDETGIKHVKPGSCRLRCPKCGKMFSESYKREMNLNGGYVHEVPELIGTHSGYQWGALASQLPALSWDVIAEALLKSSAAGDEIDQRYFDNSFRGLPFKERRITGDVQEKILKHCRDFELDYNILEAAFLVCDTQDNGWKYEIIGFDSKMNHYQLDFGLADFLEIDDEERESENADRRKNATPDKPFSPVLTVSDLLAKTFGELEISLALIDEGGHRQKEVREFVKKTTICFCYKGRGFTEKRMEFSKDFKKLLLIKEKSFRAELIGKFYGNESPEKGGYWYLMQKNDSTEEKLNQYAEEFSAVRPDASKRNGHRYENWSDGGRVHDFFDTAKMYLVIEELALSKLPLKKFRHCQAPELLKRQKK